MPPPDYTCRKYDKKILLLKYIVVGAIGIRATNKPSRVGG